MKLSCHNIGWSASNKAIVCGVSLDVQEGEMLGLIGHNGSGKSTLLKMLAGILQPTHGDITLDDRNMAKMKQRDIAQRLALVQQQADTEDRITVRDAVELGRTPWLTALRGWREEDDEIVNKALKDVDMLGFEDRQWQTLSGGERQRVHIARSLAQQPKILLLDEPTNHLDIRHQLSIMALVAKLEVTSIIALHDLNQALMCDRICVMHSGELIACGPPSEILEDGLFERGFGVDAHFLQDPADEATVIRFLLPR